MRFWIIVILLGLIGCTTSNYKQKAKSKTTNKDKGALSKGQAHLIPSGTELIFMQNHKFSEKQNALNMELSTDKRCHLSAALQREKAVELHTGAVLTVVGYRGETGDLVLSDGAYKQYYISCMNRWTPQRGTSSQPVSNEGWKTTSVDLSDLKKLMPLFKIKYLPQ